MTDDKYAGHTPEPWSYQKDWLGPETYSDGDGIPIFPSKGGVAICEVVAVNGQGLNRPDIQAMAEANANLIVDAPKLLRQRDAAIAALKTLVNFALVITQQTEFMRDARSYGLEVDCIKTAQNTIAECEEEDE